MKKSPEENQLVAGSACVRRLVLASSINERSAILEAMLVAKQSIAEHVGVTLEQVDLRGIARVSVGENIITQDYSLPGWNPSQETMGTENLILTPGKSGGSTGIGAGKGVPPAVTEPETTMVSEASES